MGILFYILSLGLVLANDGTEIIDSFDVELNDVVLDKVRQIKYEPATQNGRAVEVKYQLPILFQ